MWFVEWFKRQDCPVRDARTEPLKVLALSLLLGDRLVLERLGRQHGWDIHCTHSNAGLRLTTRSDFSVILLDRDQPCHPWREVLERLATVSPGSSILLVSPASDDYVWRDVLHHGGFGIITRPLHSETVLHAIQAAARLPL